MTDERSRDELIELPLSHKESWESVDRGEDRPTGGGSAGSRHARPPQRKSRRWLLVLLLALVGGLAYWLFWPDPPRVDFGVERLELPEQLAGTASEPETLTLTNVGEVALRVDSVGVTGGAEADFATASEDCTGRMIEPLGACEVAIRFTPKESGQRSGELVVGGNMRGKRQALALVGQAVAPRLAARPERLDFGTESVGATSAGRDLDLVNTGTAPLSIRRVAVDSEEGEFRLVGNDCSSARLAPAESCSLRLVFTPALLGRRGAELAVESDSFGAAPAIGLEGTGTGPDLAIDPQGLSFEPQLVGERSPARLLRLTNRGDETFRINRVRLARSGAFEIVRESCSGSSLEPGESCRVEVVFAPTADGEVKTSLEIREASGAMAPGVGIAGRAVSPRLELSTERIEFDAVLAGERSGTETLRLSNQGTASVSIAELRVLGEDAAAFSKGRDGCSGVELSPGRGCEVTFTFEPRRGGAHAARVTVRSSQRGRAPEVALAGQGRAPEVSLDRGRLDFAAVRQTESQDLRLTVSNSGDAPLDVTAVRLGGAAAPDFTLASNGCRQRRLSAGEECLLVVRFSPTANGPRDARLLVESNAGAPLSVVVRGAGLPAPEPDIAVAPRVLTFGALPVGERSEVLTVRISSTGEGPLRLLDMRLAGRDADDFRIVPGTCQGLERVVPEGECTMGVRFLPTAAGPRTAELVIEHDAERGPIVVTLRAEGL